MESPSQSILTKNPSTLSMDMLRFTTAGSVDDGKSTLIGRLLYDSKSIFEDQLEAIETTSRNRGNGGIDLALLTDGLRAEREQGITIDVAYRYFATPRRKFIISDTPGHTQYTRNMVTGASTADLAIILVDARKGVLTQSRRHAFISSLLHIPHIVVAVNKMDLVGYSEQRFDEIVEEFKLFSRKLEVDHITFIPISALHGDNIVNSNGSMPWYNGATLLHHLEHVNVGSRRNLIDFRFPVQVVIRPDQDFRGLAGRVASGTIRPGEEIMVLPSRQISRIARIVTQSGDLNEAMPGDSVVLTIEDDIDISRGDMIVRKRNIPVTDTTLDAFLCWMDQEALKKDKTYLFRQNTRTVQCRVKEIIYRINVDTLHREGSSHLELNEIGRVRIETAGPVFIDPYKINNATGSFILIDPASNITAGAGMIRSSSLPGEDNKAADSLSDLKTLQNDGNTEKPGYAGDHIKALKQPRDTVPAGQSESLPRAIQPASSPNTVWEPWNIQREERENRNGHKALVLWLTGIPGSGKSTIARALEQKLWETGKQTVLLDGDQVRHGLCSDLGFSPEDRSENLRRVGHTARLFYEHGNIVLCAFVSPIKSDREYVKSLFPDERFIEVHVHCDRDTAHKRDPKGLYRKAKNGEIKGLTGYDADYEESGSTAVFIDTEKSGLAECVSILLEVITGRI